MKDKKNEDLVLKGVIDIICEVMEIDKSMVKPESNLVTDLDIESLDFVDLIKAFEDKYKVQIADKDLKNINTVNDIVNYIKSKQNA